MQQIANGLEELGMSKCFERFADNDVDTRVPSELMDRDLNAHGVSLGYRRKMLPVAHRSHPQSGRSRPNIR
jgi:hypothetical protein